MCIIQTLHRVELLLLGAVSPWTMGPIVYSQTHAGFCLPCLSASVCVKSSCRKSVLLPACSDVQ